MRPREALCPARVLGDGRPQPLGLRLSGAFRSALPLGAFKLDRLKLPVFPTKFRGRDEQEGFPDEGSWRGAMRNREDLSE